jgi:hypothetical protein
MVEGEGGKLGGERSRKAGDMVFSVLVLYWFWVLMLKSQNCFEFFGGGTELAPGLSCAITSLPTTDIYPSASLSR